MDRMGEFQARLDQHERRIATLERAFTEQGKRLGRAEARVRELEAKLARLGGVMVEAVDVATDYLN